MAKKDEHGGDVATGRGIPALGCPHCPARFFKTASQVSHIQERHPDQPHAARMQIGTGNLVDYWPHMTKTQPHLLLHIDAKSNETSGKMVLGASGEVHSVETNPEYRHQGVATSLWNAAQHLHANMPGFPEPKHSASRTKEGDAWAHKVGGEIPELYAGRHISAEQFRNARW